MRILGIDGGIASIGWALIEVNAARGEIIAVGVRTFDAPETDKERTPTNQIRRQKRGMRRVIRRRRQRMALLRHLFANHGLLASDARDALKRPDLRDPWTLRVDALDRRLEPDELAVALGHIARHRGFRSNSKRERGANAPDDAKKMLKALEGTREKLARWRSFAEMLVRDPEFADRKRNRDGDYSHTAQRSDLEAETRAIFDAQRRLGAHLATEALQAAFADLAFTQRPLQDSEHMVAQCPFEPDQKRTAKRSPAFELFRVLSRLANLKLISLGQEQRLSAEQIAMVTADFGAQKTITYKTVRLKLKLDGRTRFDGVPLANEIDDVAARSGVAAEGTSVLRRVLGTAWSSLAHRPALLDRIAEIITFRDDLGSIESGLAELDLEPIIVAALMEGVRAGDFAKFTGAGHISAKAARKILPHLARGLVYSEACAEVGYDHAARAAMDIKDVRNPTARKAVGEMLKQVRAIAQAYGEPDRIHVELARDLGKSAGERDEIKHGIEKRTAEKERRRGEFAELLGRGPNDEELLRYELWKEQNCRCLYTDTLIRPEALDAADNSVQVDHILPWSRFGDDSFANKTLCLTAANQHKRGHTPFEWLTADGKPHSWALFEARVEDCKSMKGRKKRGFYLRRNAAEVEEGFKARNLGDTRYATRLLLDMLARRYPVDGTVHVRARPGALTAKLRRAWGLEDIKKDEQGKRREDDRHHALDALVIAATTQRALNDLTVAFQQAERRGLSRELTHAIPEPWEGFRDEARAAVERVFVSRAERRRARGEAHAATIRQVRERDGRTIVYERKSVDALKPADVERIKDKERNAAVQEALVAWIAAGKPKDAPPRSPKGDVIRKVRLETNGKEAVAVRGGTADRGEMVRVDVFRERGAGKRRDRFHLVPIYPHQVADRQTFLEPPNRAVVAFKDEGDWTDVSTFDFQFSLFANNLIEIAKTDGEVIQGYFRGLHRGTGNISISEHNNARDIKAGLGPKTLLHFLKFSIDRLGRIAPIERETRTWHGEVCI
ncbi:MAG: type II CRISPR RNA-guided endonuclease Cas9 [Acetobacteraceae bacterium]